MRMFIREDDLTGPEIAQLLTAHLAAMARLSPPESVHALPLDALKSPAVTVWTAWDGPELLGVGALKEISARHGEVKSMHTAERVRRRGIGAHILTHILNEARACGYERVSLETGALEGHAGARALYERFGFEYCAPFADYKADPYSAFLTLALKCRRDAG